MRSYQAGCLRNIILWLKVYHKYSNAGLASPRNPGHHRLHQPLALDLGRLEFGFQRIAQTHQLLDAGDGDGAALCGAGR